MGSLFRVKTTRYVTEGGKRCKRTDPGARKVTVKSAKWYADVPLDGGGTRRVPLDADRGRSVKMLADLLKDARTPLHERMRKKPLAEHLADFEAEARRQPRGKQGGAPCEEYLAALVRQIRTGLQGLVSPSDVTLDAVRANLARYAAGSSLPEVEPREYKLAEVVGLLGRSETGIYRSIRRHRLAVSGRGKYPPETVLALARLRRCTGAGTQAVRHACLRLRRFGRWLADRCGWPRSPLDGLAGPKGDKARHARRALSDDEVARLLAATRESRAVLHDLAGGDRSVLYLVVLLTGLRRSEAGAVTPSWFDLDAEVPAMTIPAAVDKRGVRAVQPLPPDALPALRAYLAGRDPHAPLWPGRWVANAADTLRRDLLAAGVPYAVPAEDGLAYADFHGLRHTFIASLDRAGLTLKQAMALARHSTPTLTARVYGRASLEELGRAMARVKVPGLVAGLVAGTAENRLERSSPGENRVDGRIDEGGEKEPEK